MLPISHMGSSHQVDRRPLSWRFLQCFLIYCSLSNDNDTRGGCAKGLPHHACHKHDVCIHPFLSEGLSGSQRVSACLLVPLWFVPCIEKTLGQYTETVVKCSRLVYCRLHKTYNLRFRYRKAKSSAQMTSRFTTWQLMASTRALSMPSAVPCLGYH